MARILTYPSGSPVKHQDKDVLGFDYVGVVKAVDSEKRLLIMVGTDETKDRDGDIIRLSGWSLDNYKKNPVFLWSHNYGSVPLARAEKVIKRKEPPRMEFHLYFPTKGIYPFADMILDLYSEKIINSSSVGFIPTKWNPIEEEESAGNRRQYGREFVGQELLELSGCAVPSNPNALQSALKGRNFGFKIDDLVKSLSGGLLVPRPDKEDLVLEEQDKQAVEIEDETTPVMVQVPVDLVPEDPLTLSDADGIEKDEALKPYPNEHACRLMSPDEFERFARKNCHRKVDDKCVDYIFGIKDEKTHLQAMRFKSDVWTVAGARAVCERAGGSFEAAKPPKSEDAPTILEENVPLVPAEPVEVPVVEGEKITLGDISKKVDSLKSVMDSISQVCISLKEAQEGFQASLANLEKAIEESQGEQNRRASSSGDSAPSAILGEAFRQGKEGTRTPVSTPNARGYNKESLEDLKKSILELMTALKSIQPQK